jgi:hypothetical protein
MKDMIFHTLVTRFAREQVNMTPEEPREKSPDAQGRFEDITEVD